MPSTNDDVAKLRQRIEDPLLTPGAFVAIQMQLCELGEYGEGRRKLAIGLESELSTDELMKLKSDHSIYTTEFMKIESELRTRSLKVV